MTLLRLLENYDIILSKHEFECMLYILHVTILKCDVLQ